MAESLRIEAAGETLLLRGADLDSWEASLREAVPGSGILAAEAHGAAAKACVVEVERLTQAPTL